MVRYPVSNNIYYEEDFGKLDKQIRDCFQDSNGPGDFPVKRKDKKVFGIITSNSQYSLSGPCQAWAYKEIAESQFPETYIILAPNHKHTIKNIVISSLDWQTPFGIIKNDNLLGERLAKEFDFIEINDAIHESDSSIEVQLPFLQYSSKDNFRQLKILPINVNDISFEQINQISDFLKNYNLTVIASSDLTHFGPLYNFTPFVYNKLESLKQLDNEALTYIKNFDTENFIKFINNKKVTIYGYASIALSLEIAKKQGSKLCRQLHYYTSSDLSEDQDNSISFVSLVLE